MNGKLEQKLKQFSIDNDPLLLNDDLSDLQFMDFEQQMKMYDQMQEEDQETHSNT